MYRDVLETWEYTYEIRVYLGTKGVPWTWGCTWKPGIYLGTVGIPETQG